MPSRNSATSQGALERGNNVYNRVRLLREIYLLDSVAVQFITNKVLTRYANLIKDAVNCADVNCKKLPA